jgi:large subunit ribosomal protein L24
MKKIKKNDDVVAISGKDKGRRGQVLKVLGDGRLLVSNMNLVKKHKRANPNAGEQGGIVSQEAPIHASNVAIWNHKDSKADKVRVMQENGERFRVFKSSGDRVED